MTKFVSKCLLILAVLVLAASLGLAACGGSGHHAVKPKASVSTPYAAPVQGHPCSPTNYYQQCAVGASGQFSLSPVLDLRQSFVPAFGIDFAWGGPYGATARALGARFGVSYLSGTSKDWSTYRLNSFRNAGLGVGFVWETTQYRPLSGCSAGTVDAQRANGELRALGYAGAPIFFAVDFDTTGYSTFGVVGQYFRCAVNQLGTRAGAYGGLRTMQIAAANGMTHLWNTLAWSYGRWDPRACLRQYAIDLNWHGYNVDYNVAVCSNWGQFNPGPPPPPPDPYAYLDKTVRQFGNAKASEYNTVKTWDRAKCANPVKRSVCKSSFYHLELLSGRVYYLATHSVDGHKLKHPRWSEPNKRQPWGSRFAAMSNRIHD